MMGEVLPFRRKPAFRCVSDGEAAEIQAILHQTLSECPACKGRGVFLYSGRDRFGVAPCPCGGDDENRTDPDEPDYPGAA